MMRRTDRIWLLGGIVITCLLAVASWFVVIHPQRTNTESVRGQISDENIQLAKLRRQLAGLDAKQKQLPTLLAQLKTSRDALPSEDALPADNPQAAFLNQLQDAGTAENVDISSVTVGSPVKSDTLGTVNEVPIALSVAGTIDDMTQFLLRLQSMAGRAVLISAVGLTFATNTDGTPSNQVTTSLTITAFETAGSASTSLTTK